jgi:hypothetical protein
VDDRQPPGDPAGFLRWYQRIVGDVVHQEQEEEPP